VPNFFEKMIVKMLTHVHKVVNTCWCWHICEGSRVCVVERGLGSPLPPVELARRDSSVFEELKRLFFTTSEVGKETEANGGHSGDRTLNRTRSRFDRTCPVSSTQQSGARVLGFATGASGPSWNWSVRSGTQRSRVWRRADRTCGASGHTRSDASGHDGSSLDRDQTLALSRPVVAWSASGHIVARAGTVRTCVSGHRV
jgi:hypothetical protein